MIRNILSNRHIKLLKMALDKSLTDHERSGFILKIFEGIDLRGICKHTIAMVSSDETIAPYDEKSGLFRARTPDEAKRDEEELSRKVHIAVQHALHQAETKHALEKAKQDCEISALKAQLAHRAHCAGTNDTTDTVHSLHPPELAPKVDVSAAEEDICGDDTENAITPQAYCRHVEDVAGRRHWKTAFAHHVGITMQTLKAELQGKIVPRRFIAVLNTLRTDELLPASRQHWTIEERNRLSLLLEEGLSNFDLAHRLSSEFRRRIFEGGVARQRRRLQRLSGKDDTAASQHARRSTQRRRNFDITAAGPCIA